MNNITRSSSYVEYGTGNMLNIDVGTVKRKIDSNEYDDDIVQEVQPNGKRTCNFMNPGSNTPYSMTSNGYNSMHGYQTPESSQSSVTASPFESSSSMDMDMGSEATYQSSATMVENANTMLNTAITTPMSHQNSNLLPSALPGQNTNAEENMEYIPVHGRSMEIPSYARVPVNEVRKYRDQRWSSCIYGTDSRIGQGMMI
ncbi:hypothetical protein BGZ76_008834 [Entomortierella beljakovae]|nr:hypothetical protein BGZ76_008834 [Entomortierella beljakovae]